MPKGQSNPLPPPTFPAMASMAPLDQDFKGTSPMTRPRTPLRCAHRRARIPEIDLAAVCRRLNFDDKIQDCTPPQARRGPRSPSPVPTPRAKTPTGSTSCGVPEEIIFLH